jgi:hypothetical protein
MAREFEHAQLGQLLQTTPPGSPAYWMILKNIFDLSSLSEKEPMLQIIEQMLKSSMEPPPEPKPDIDQQIDAAELQRKVKSDADKLNLENKRINANVLMDQIDGGGENEVAKANLKVMMSEHTRKIQDMINKHATDKEKHDKECDKDKESKKEVAPVINITNNIPDGNKSITINRGKDKLITGAEVN